MGIIIVRVFFTVLVLGPIFVAIRNRNKNRDLPAGENLNYVPVVINSAVLFALAYNLIFFIQELFLVLGKKALGLKAYLYHNNHGWDGEHPMESLMQGSGALAIFIMGILFLLIFQIVRNSKSVWKVFLLWLAFHGLMQSIPQVVVANFAPDTDVGQALVGYLYLGEMTLTFLGVFGIIATASISGWFAKPLLEMAPKFSSSINPKSKLKYLRFAAALASLLGLVLIAPFRIPPLTQALAPISILLVTIPWVWVMGAHTKNVKPIPNEMNEKIMAGPIVALVVLLLVFRLVLAPGVTF